MNILLLTTLKIQILLFSVASISFIGKKINKVYLSPMNMLKGLSSLYGKFTLSFYIISVMLALSILSLLYAHERSEHHTQLRQLTSSLILKIDEISIYGKALNHNNIEQRVEYSQKIDEFRKEFDLLLENKLEKIFKKNDSTQTTIFLNTLNQEEQLLYFSHDIWNRIRKNADYIQYNEITYDSVYTELELQRKWETDSLIKFLPLVNDISKNVLTKEAKIALSNIDVLSRSLKSKLWELRKLHHERQINSFSIFSTALVIILFINLLVIFILYKVISNQTFKPLLQIKDDLNFNLKNKRFSKLNYQSNDELGEITESINFLLTDNKKAQDYINKLDLDKIENAEILINMDNSSPLQLSLVNMHDQLRTIAIKENQRNWIVEGQTIFSGLLSKHNSDFETLCDEIIKKLVQYTEGLQGGLFVLNRNTNTLKMASCYAFDRKKFVNNTIEKGDGIVGQVWQEQKSVFITDLPEDHMVIKSGLGSQAPKCLLVVPLIENGVFYGIIELASFKIFEQFKIDFVEKIAENIATTLAGVETTKQTQLLLSESQELTLKMKEQEEEMLQNLEELQATQEEMRRREILKDKELLEIQQQTNKKIKNSKEKEKELKDTILKLQEELEKSITDNSAIRKLKTTIEEMEAEHKLKIKDLEETIRIKEMKVDKMRKKLDN